MPNFLPNLRKYRLFNKKTKAILKLFLTCLQVIVLIFEIVPLVNPKNAKFPH